MGGGRGLVGWVQGRVQAVLGVRADCCGHPLSKLVCYCMLMSKKIVATYNDWLGRALSRAIRPGR